MLDFIPRRQERVGCTVSVSHCFESLGAHVELDGSLGVHPGDRIRVHGAPIHVKYGETACERRDATIIRAPWWERAWFRVTGDFEYMELLDVSFTDERLS